MLVISICLGTILLLNYRNSIEKNEVPKEIQQKLNDDYVVVLQNIPQASYNSLTTEYDLNTKLLLALKKLYGASTFKKCKELDLSKSDDVDSKKDASEKYKYYTITSNGEEAYCGMPDNSSQTHFLSNKQISDTYKEMFDEKISDDFVNEVIEIETLFKTTNALIDYNYIKYDKKNDGFIFLFISRDSKSGLPMCPAYYYNNIRNSTLDEEKLTLTYSIMEVGCDYEDPKTGLTIYLDNNEEQHINYVYDEKKDMTTLIFDKKDKKEIKGNRISNYSIIDDIYDYYKKDIKLVTLSFDVKEDNYYFKSIKAGK